MADFVKREEIENKPFNILEELEQEETFTEGEINQARQLKLYLASSKANNELYLFLEKSLKNIQAKEIKYYRESKEQATREAFNSSLPYKDD